MKRVLLSFSLLAIVGVAFVACSSGKKATPTPAASASTTVAPSPTATAASTPATVSTAVDAKLGAILVGPTGMTLYVAKNDGPNQSNCSTACLAVWPPLTVASGVTPVAGPGVTGKLGVISGSGQVTYNGAPLYGWKTDVKPGDTTGQGVGPFTVALVSTVAVTPAASATPKTGN